ncbi:Hypothetical predicted protein [Olea europaea subsp. europaea]|uniref:Uncharacterized protein n=1 Tax=Olea europaea subsp. europaea TaxID=158383 RepID=A0A8S0RP71_OLEEU|nr:Hypothetical predicted protein [Olea europaea subsp. europaea]
MEPSPDERDMRADTGTAHLQDGGDIAARPDNVHDPLPVATDEQIGGGQIESIFAVPELNDGGAMEPSHAAPSNDATYRVAMLRMVMAISLKSLFPPVWPNQDTEFIRRVGARHGYDVQLLRPGLRIQGRRSEQRIKRSMNCEDSTTVVL